MNLVALGRALRRGWYWVALILIVAVVGGWIASSALPKQYESRARLLYSLDAQGPLQTQLQATSVAAQRAATDAQLVATPTILEPALATLGDPDLTYETVAAGVAAAAVETLVDVAVTLPDAEDAAQVAAAIVDQLRQNAALDTITADPTNPASPVYNFTITTVIPPSVATNPSSPNTAINVMIAFAVGILIAAIYLGTSMSRDKRLYDPAQIAPLTTAPVVGSLGLRARGEALPQDVATVRTALQARAGSGATWLLTGAGDVDSAPVGRALATSLAAIGGRPMLLTTDAGSADAGLTDYLLGETSIEQIADEVSLPGVIVVTAGTHADQAGDVYAQPSTGDRLHELTKSGQYVFVTAEPADTSADAAILARLGVRTLVVVRRGRTTSTQLAKALASLTEAGAEVTGVLWTSGVR